MDWVEPNFAKPSPFLPPEEVRLINLRKDGRLETPVDPHTGIVDRQALMQLMRETVVPEYTFRAPHIGAQKSDHHLQWPHYRFESVFRNRRTRRTNIAPIAHNWIHESTFPPAALSEEVEREYTGGQVFADELRSIASHPMYIGREALRIYREVYPHMGTEQRDIVRREVREDKKLDLEFAFDSFSHIFEQARTAPAEFQVINYDEVRLDNVTDMMHVVHLINKSLKQQAELDQMILDGAVTIDELSLRNQ